MSARTLRPSRAAAVICGAAALGAAAGHPHPAGAAAVTVAPGAPAACSGVQITDAVGDGHHANTDLTAAWLTRASGPVQAVLVTKDGAWRPAHDDSASATWAMLWQYGGATRYVRLLATQAGALSYDHGTWSAAGGFASVGATTGAVSPTGPNGWVSIDVPAEAGGTDGSLLGGPFALTADGEEAGSPHWVDRAPGGTAPADPASGADWIVGPCPATAAPAATPIAGVPAIAPLTAVGLDVPSRITGGRSALAVRGTVTPPRAGVAVSIAKTTPARTVHRTVTTDATGAYVLRTPITERTQLRATAGGLNSQTLTLDVRSKVRITTRRTKAGGLVVTGTVSPGLPGRVLWLRTDAVVPSATGRTASGRFSLRLAHPARGRYQALVIPDRSRAQRALSNQGTVR